MVHTSQCLEEVLLLLPESAIEIPPQTVNAPMQPDCEGDSSKTEGMAK